MTPIEQFIQDNMSYLSRYLVDNDQGGVDFKILPYLKHITNGVFLEAGAFDGILQSNTKILEDLGWTGLLIEPSPNKANQCKINRRSPVENCALVSFDFGNKYVGFDSLDHPVAKIVQIDDNPLSGIPTKTLTEILDAYNLYNIDFFSLDTEGYELEILKGIDFDKINIKYMMIEVNSDDYSFEDLSEFLKSKGYRVVTNMSNFTPINAPQWPGNHQDYLFEKI